MEETRLGGEFMDEDRLLKVMACAIPRTKVSYSTGEPSSLPGFFPPIYRCTCVMESFDLPTLDGLHLIEGLCDGVLTGVEALAGFPSFKTLPYAAVLGFHGVNVYGSESRNKSMVINIENPYEHTKTEEVARKWKNDGLVVAVSDSLSKYEKMAVVPGTEPKVVSTLHAQAKK
ncbi:hypothetical protein C0995_002372 [Termitomyces sp. Mi166|nr:hypothetical protein C0995_002372 [Termitomyces sp. Mi166\